MNDVSARENLYKIGSFNGIDIYKIRSEKFKTNTINVFFHDNLNHERATKNALLPAVLRRGCKSFPSLQDIALYLEELYGAIFDCGVVKKGETQIVHFYMEFISDRYTGDDESLFEKAYRLLYEIITQPVLENEVFRTDYVEQEKENLRKLIEGRINDKLQYAVDKCLEEMCKDEPFSIYEYGSVDDLKDIDSNGLYEYYIRTFLPTLPVSIFITGDVEDGKIQGMMDLFSGMKRGPVKHVVSTPVKKDVKEIRHVTEKMNVNQGKLSIGFRTNIGPSDEEYNSLIVYSSILGGGPHSKLFQNVREKASLAYYAFSRLERFKGLMVISSGIEAENKDKALEIIFDQIEDMKKGNITDYEFDSAIKYLENGLKSMRDSQLQIVDYYLSQVIAGTNYDFDTLINKIKKVTKQDVTDIAAQIQPDTIYFLTAEDK